MRNSRDLVAVLLLLALFVAAGLLLGGRGTGAARLPGPEAVPDPSYTNDRASGSRGAFVWAQTLGYEPVPWRQSWSRLSPSENGVLLVIAPSVQETLVTLTGTNGQNGDKTQLTAQDAIRLRRWLNLGAGHTAILLSSRLGSGQSNAKPSSDEPDSFGDALDLVVEAASPDTGRTEFAPLQPVADTQGILSVHSSSGSRIKRTRPDGFALFGDSAGPLALEIPVGRGRLIAIADDDLFSNRQLPRSENAVLLANLLAHYGHPGGRVLFDEYHHGNVRLGRFRPAPTACADSALLCRAGTGSFAGGSVRPARAAGSRRCPFVFGLCRLACQFVPPGGRFADSPGNPVPPVPA